MSGSKRGSPENEIMDYPEEFDPGEAEFREERQDCGKGVSDGERKPVRLRDIELPAGLYARVIRQYITAAAFAIFTAAFLWITRDPRLIVGFAVSGTLVFLGISLKYDYGNGKISEIALLCASVNAVKYRKCLRVVFRTQGELPEYFEFIVPGKRTTEFLPNYVYLVYFNPDNPKELLGYVQL